MFDPTLHNQMMALVQDVSLLDALANQMLTCTLVSTNDDLCWVQTGAQLTNHHIPHVLVEIPIFSSTWLKH